MRTSKPVFMRFSPGYRLFFILSALRDLSSIQKTNKNPTRAAAIISLIHEKGVPGSMSKGRLEVGKECRIFVVDDAPFCWIFQKPNKKPDSHEKHESTRNSRYDMLSTQKSQKNSGFHRYSPVTILTLYEMVHASGQSSLLGPALQALISEASSNQSCNKSPESLDFGDFSISS